MQRPFRITHVNKAWTELCGFELEECQGKSLSILQVSLVWWWIAAYESVFVCDFRVHPRRMGVKVAVLEK